MSKRQNKKARRANTNSAVGAICPRSKVDVNTTQPCRYYLGYYERKKIPLDRVFISFVLSIIAWVVCCAEVEGSGIAIGYFSYLLNVIFNFVPFFTFGQTSKKIAQAIVIWSLLVLIIPIFYWISVLTTVDISGVFWMHSTGKFLPEKNLIPNAVFWFILGFPITVASILHILCLASEKLLAGDRYFNISELNEVNVGE